MNDNLKNKIIEDFGIANVDRVEQEEIIEKIGNLLFESVIERSIDGLDESLVSNFETVLNGAEGDYQKVVDFLKSNVPNFDSIVKEEMSRLKKATGAIFA